MKIIIFGSTGMLGSQIKLTLEQPNNNLNVFSANRRLIELSNENDILISDYSCLEELSAAIKSVSPDYVINCSGAIKQSNLTLNIPKTLTINSIFPNLLSELALKERFKLIHFSTDCVFSGSKGNYNENDPCDVNDIYGLSKFLGEVNNKNTLTIRTSIIGHGIQPNKSLIDWFLSQSGEISGFKNAVFSGLPTIEIAEIVKKIILEKDFKSGLFNLSADPINKYDLLCMVRDIYKKQISIKENFDLSIDRSLNSSKFRKEFQYEPPKWRELIRKMHSTFLQSNRNKISL